MTKCAECGQVAAFTPVTWERTWQLGERQFKATIEGEQCAACGESFWDGRSIAAAENAIRVELIRLGSTDGASFRFLREGLRLYAKDLARLLNVSAETITRWETGRRPVDRAAWAVLAQLFLEHQEGTHATRDRLEAAGKARKPRRVIRVTPAQLAAQQAVR